VDSYFWGNEVVREIEVRINRRLKAVDSVRSYPNIQPDVLTFTISPINMTLTFTALEIYNAHHILHSRQFVADGFIYPQPYLNSTVLSASAPPRAENKLSQSRYNTNSTLTHIPHPITPHPSTPQITERKVHSTPK
jgi:hypothetical protein